MKRTTYIIFGMLLAGLVVMCGGIFYSTKLFTGWDDYVMNINGEQKTVQLPECKVVQLVAERDVIASDEDRTVIRMVSFTDSPLIVSPAQAANGAFTYASDMDKYMTMTTSGDTLRIVFNFSKEKLEEKFRDMTWLNVRSEVMKITLPDNVQALSTDLETQVMHLDGFDRDSLSLYSRGHTTMNDCNFRALTAQGGSWAFNSGKVDNLHLYLNAIRDWHVTVGSFSIDTEYLYAHGYKRCTLEKGECRQVVWVPQSDDALLNIDLKQAARVITE